MYNFVFVYAQIPIPETKRYGVRRQKNYRLWENAELVFGATRWIILISSRSRSILETFSPLNQDTVARFHRSAPQPPQGLNTSVCLLAGVAPPATKNPPPFPQSTPLLMLMFKWAYWFFHHIVFKLIRLAMFCWHTNFIEGGHMLDSASQLLGAVRS